MPKKMLPIVILASLTLVHSPLGYGKSIAANSKSTTQAAQPPQSGLAIESAVFQQEMNGYITQAINFAKAKQYADAMGQLDKVVSRYQQIESRDGLRLLSARSSQEATALHNLIQPSTDKPIKIVPENLQAALYLQGYIYNELGRYSQAGTVLDTALYYAPTNAQLYNERALSYQAQKDWTNAKQYFQMAEKMSQYSPDSENQDKTRAWRGLGFIAIEEHRFDDAVAWYQKCLAVDPNDAQAKQELAYIAKIRGNPPQKNTLPFSLITK